ncbi:MAG: hypothetical protein ACRD2T_07600 [Thermoanaerobaculia bacterium]
MPAKVDKRSRYAKTPVRTVVDARREELAVFELREIPPTTGVLRLIATAVDRLDLLAHRFYRDPTKFWRLCDASDDLDPTDVVAVNAVVVIPPNK